MTLQASGLISLSQVNTELGNSSTAPISLNNLAVRTLAGKASGTISMSDLYGKTNGPAEFTINVNQNSGGICAYQSVETECTTSSEWELIINNGVGPYQITWSKVTNNYGALQLDEPTYGNQIITISSTESVPVSDDFKVEVIDYGYNASVMKSITFTVYHTHFSF